MRRARPVQARRGRRGFTLLEVILSLAILAGALAVLGELVRLGLESAAEARDLSEAQLLCESLVAEIAAGAAYAEPVANQAIVDAAGWLYSVETEPTDDEELLSMRVTVARDPSTPGRPVSFSIVRLVKDPNAAEPASDENQDSTSSSSGSSSASSTTSGGGT